MYYQSFKLSLKIHKYHYLNIKFFLNLSFAILVFHFIKIIEQKLLHVLNIVVALNLKKLNIKNSG